MLFPGAANTDIFLAQIYGAGAFDTYLAGPRLDNALAYLGKFNGVTLGALYSLGGMCRPAPVNAQWQRMPRLVCRAEIRRAPTWGVGTWIDEQRGTTAAATPATTDLAAEGSAPGPERLRHAQPDQTDGQLHAAQNDAAIMRTARAACGRWALHTRSRRPSHWRLSTTTSTTRTATTAARCWRCAEPMVSQAYGRLRHGGRAAQQRQCALLAIGGREQHGGGTHRGQSSDRHHGRTAPHLLSTRHASC